MHKYNERAKLIGQISFQYAYLDYQVSNIVWNTLNLDKKAGIIVTGSLDIRPKIDMAINLLEYYKVHNDLLSFLKIFKNRVSSKNGIINRRNLLVHGIYSSRDGDPIVMVESHRNQRHRERKSITVKYIKETLDDIDKEINLLIELMKKYSINLD